MILEVKGNTWFKISDRPASSLSDKEKFFARKGETFKLDSWLDIGNHLKITLKYPLHGRKTWCCFEKHVIVDSGGCVVPEVGTHLGYPNCPAPYYDQRDNKLNPHGSCNVSSYASWISYYGKARKRFDCQLEDELYSYMKNKGLRPTYHADLVKMGRAYGLDPIFSTETHWKDVKLSLLNGHPVIISGQFTRSGHIIVLRGYDDKGFFVNDPYGEHMPGGKYGWYLPGSSGENLHYSYKKIYKASYGGNQTTWAHLVREFETAILREVIPKGTR